MAVNIAAGAGGGYSLFIPSLFRSLCLPNRHQILTLTLALPTLTLYLPNPHQILAFTSPHPQIRPPWLAKLFERDPCPLHFSLILNFHFSAVVAGGVILGAQAAAG